MDARREAHGMKKPLKAADCIPTGGKLRNHNTTQLVPDIWSKNKIVMYKNEFS